MAYSKTTIPQALRPAFETARAADPLYTAYQDAKRKAEATGLAKLRPEERGRLRHMGTASLDVPGAQCLDHWVKVLGPDKEPVCHRYAWLVRPDGMESGSTAEYRLVEAPTAYNRLRRRLGYAPVGRVAPSTAQELRAAARLPQTDRVRPVWRAVDIEASWPTALGWAALGLAAGSLGVANGLNAAFWLGVGWTGAACAIPAAIAIGVAAICALVLLVVLGVPFVRHQVLSDQGEALRDLAAAKLAWHERKEVLASELPAGRGTPHRLVPDLRDVRFAASRASNAKILQAHTSAPLV